MVIHKMILIYNLDNLNEYT